MFLVLAPYKKEFLLTLSEVLFLQADTLIMLYLFHIFSTKELKHHCTYNLYQIARCTPDNLLESANSLNIILDNLHL